LKSKIVKLPDHRSSPPHCCIVTGRRDGPVVDWGELTEKARGPQDPHVYIRVSQVEHVAAELLGMVSQKRYDEALAELEEANTEAGRLRAIVAGKEGLSEAEGKLREALGPASTPEGS
jgi:hypothetical protein